MAKWIEINGETFEVKRSHKTADMIDSFYENYRRRDLWDYYEKPSDIKLRIYHKWLDWYLSDDEIADFEVTSGNTFQFTIQASLYVPDYGLCLAVITKCNNYLYVQI